MTIMGIPVRLDPRVPVGEIRLQRDCACCQRAPVFAGVYCLRCHEIDSAKQAAKTAAEMAHVLVRK